MDIYDLAAPHVATSMLTWPPAMAMENIIIFTYIYIYCRVRLGMLPTHTVSHNSVVHNLWDHKPHRLILPVGNEPTSMGLAMQQKFKGTHATFPTAFLLSVGTLSRTIAPHPKPQQRTNPNTIGGGVEGNRKAKASQQIEKPTPAESSGRLVSRQRSSCP
jgi:hypothetical protein